MLAIWTCVAWAATVCSELSPSNATCDYLSVQQALDSGADLLELLPGIHVVNVTLQRPVHVRPYEEGGTAWVVSGQAGQPAFLVEGPQANGTVLEGLHIVRGQLLVVRRASVEVIGLRSRRVDPQQPLLEVQDEGTLQVLESDLYDFQLLAPLVRAKDASLVVEGGVLAGTSPGGPLGLIEGGSADVSLSHVALLGRGLPALVNLEEGSLQVEQALLRGGEAQGGISAKDVDQVTLSSLVLQEMDEIGLSIEGSDALVVTGLIALRNEGGVLNVSDTDEVELAWSVLCDNQDAVSVDALRFGLTHTLLGWNRGFVLEGVQPLPWFGTLLVGNASAPPWPVPEGNPAQQGPPALGPLACEDADWLAAWGVGPCPDCVDRDGDLVPETYDCDDEHPGISPGEREIVGDAIDQDCDGQDACWDGSPPGSDFDCDQDGVRFAEDCDDRWDRVGQCQILLAGGCSSGPAQSPGGLVLGALALLARRRDARRRPQAFPGGNDASRAALCPRPGGGGLSLEQRLPGRAGLRLLVGAGPDRAPRRDCAAARAPRVQGMLEIS